eukprot:gene9714-9779_t
MAAQPETATYFPNVFDVADEQRAKAIILTPEGPGAETDTRWTLETPYVLELITQCIALGAGTLVIDYGCGIGRMAKAMIDSTGCAVIGVDISADMRRLAADYVASERFLAVSPAQFDLLVQGGLRAQAAIAVWVLQHCLSPADDIARIASALAPDGRCFVLNMPTRAVPALRHSEGSAPQFVWAADGQDVAALLRAALDPLAEGEPDRSRTPNMADVGAYWMSLCRR